MNDKKVVEHLFSARWATKAGKPDAAYEEITDALILLGALKEESAPEPDRPSDPMPETFENAFIEPVFVTVKGVRYKDRGQYQTPSGQFCGLVVHYTVSGRTEKSARGVVSYMTSKGLCCLVMDEDGKIYIPEGFDVLKNWGAHAGVSAWGNMTSLSNKFAGMEICCWGKDSKVGPIRSSKGEDNIIAGDYQEYTPAQEEALINFILWARARNPEFKLENVIGHDEARAAAGQPGAKTDPGASLSVTMPKFRRILEIRETQS